LTLASRCPLLNLPILDQLISSSSKAHCAAAPRPLSQNSVPKEALLQTGPHHYSDRPQTVFLRLSPPAPRGPHARVPSLRAPLSCHASRPYRNRFVGPLAAAPCQARAGACVQAAQVPPYAGHAWVREAAHAREEQALECLRGGNRILRRVPQSASCANRWSCSSSVTKRLTRHVAIPAPRPPSHAASPLRYHATRTWLLRSRSSSNSPMTLFRTGVEGACASSPACVQSPHSLSMRSCMRARAMQAENVRDQ
jgi:hypothetical protein